MRFLCIDDSENDQELVRALVKRTKHWQFFGASSISEGLLTCQEEDIQIVLIDLCFPGRPLAETYQAIYTLSQATCVIAVSGDDSQDAVNKARDAGAVSFINKRSLNDPKSFHDSVLASVTKKLSRGIGKSASDVLLTQIATDIYYGNGKPGVLARLEGIDEGVARLKGDLLEVKTSQKDMQLSQDLKLDNIRMVAESNFQEIREKQDGDRLETRIRGVILILGLIGSLVSIWLKSSAKETMDAVKQVMEQVGK
jgi:DNA-binding response OmpR family regulator